MIGDICLTCEHYIEETDYCDLDLFDADEKSLHEETSPVTECLYYEWKDEKDYIYPLQHGLLG